MLQKLYSFIFKRKYKITLVDKDFSPVRYIKTGIIPRINELIFMEKENIYFRVIDIIHYINENHGIFIKIEKI